MCAPFLCFMRLLASCCYKKQPVNKPLVFDSDKFRNPQSGSTLRYQCEGEKALGRRIGIEDIGYYADKITVYEKILVRRDSTGSPIYKTGVKEYRVKGLFAQKSNCILLMVKQKKYYVIRFL